MKKPKVLDGSKMSIEEIRKELGGFEEEKEFSPSSEISDHLVTLQRKIEDFNEDDLDFSIWIKNPEILFSLGLKKAEQILEFYIQMHFEDLGFIPVFKRTDESFYGFDVHIDNFGKIADVSFADKKVLIKTNLLSNIYWKTQIDKKENQLELKNKEYDTVPKNKFWYSNLKKEFYNSRRNEIGREATIIKRDIEELKLKSNLRKDIALIYERVYDVFTEAEYKIFDVQGDVNENNRKYKDEIYNLVGVYL